MVTQRITLPVGRAAQDAATTTVTINPEKPRKGCFEVKVGDEIILSLLDMPRPFLKLKALEMEDVAKQCLKALKN